MAFSLDTYPESVDPRFMRPLVLCRESLLVVHCGDLSWLDLDFGILDICLLRHQLLHLSPDAFTNHGARMDVMSENIG